MAPYLIDLEASGFGDYFASDRAAVLYAQNLCRDPDAASGDRLDRIVARWSDDEELLRVDVTEDVPLVVELGDDLHG